MHDTRDLKQVLDGAGLEAKTIRLARGEALFRTGDSVHRMYYVLDGLLVMVRILESGKELVVQRANPGSLFAEASLFSDRYHCDAVSETDATCAIYDKAAVIAALKDPDVSLAVLRAYSMEIRSLRSQIELRNIKRADDRVLAYLGTLAVGKDGWREPGLSWKDIARSLGLTHEACYRALASLARSRQIERDESRYRLL